MAIFNKKKKTEFKKVNAKKDEGVDDDFGDTFDEEIIEEEIIEPKSKSSSISEIDNEDDIEVLERKLKEAKETKQKLLEEQSKTTQQQVQFKPRAVSVEDMLNYIYDRQEVLDSKIVSIYMYLQKLDSYLREDN